MPASENANRSPHSDRKGEERRERKKKELCQQMCLPRKACLSLNHNRNTFLLAFCFGCPWPRSLGAQRIGRWTRHALLLRRPTAVLLRTHPPFVHISTHLFGSSPSSSFVARAHLILRSFTLAFPPGTAQKHAIATNFFPDVHPSPPPSSCRARAHSPPLCSFLMDFVRPIDFKFFRGSLSPFTTPYTHTHQHTN